MDEKQNVEKPSLEQPVVNKHNPDKNDLQESSEKKLPTWLLVLMAFAGVVGLWALATLVFVVFRG